MQGGGRPAAAVSTDYFTRLEQGRIRPSASALAALAQVLCLADNQRDRLFLAAHNHLAKHVILKRSVGRQGHRRGRERCGRAVCPCGQAEPSERLVGRGAVPSQNEGVTQGLPPWRRTRAWREAGCAKTAGRCPPTTDAGGSATGRRRRRESWSGGRSSAPVLTEGQES
ncbi:helix-turn-helix domain-containing protein [Streptomyces griseorubiginosus]|uniref:helix-turn-helix domain-containing protein n=1 Tax=Streptomyces TaxID=1883 RepID=UPI003D15FD96